jgi:archaellum component FlaG (FlaF/FlaG flagellin family)
MKKLLFLALAFCTVNVFAQKKADEVAKFNIESFDFGKVEQNKPATATFVVKNIGTEPLIIDQAAPSCGCTVSDYTKSPIAPGKTGTIKATFNAAAMGPIDKTVTVKLAGIDDVKFLKLKGEVVAATATAAKKK